MMAVLKQFFSAAVKRDLMTWHRCTPFFPVRLPNGEYTERRGQVWRRKRPDGTWEYKQDEYTLDDWYNEQW